MMIIESKEMRVVSPLKNLMFLVVDLPWPSYLGDRTL